MFTIEELHSHLERLEREYIRNYDHFVNSKVDSTDPTVAEIQKKNKERRWDEISHLLAQINETKARITHYNSIYGKN